MLLAIDIGNSSIKLGVFGEDKLITRHSIPTKRDYSSNEISQQLKDRLPAAIDAVIVCSVVPEVECAIHEYCNVSLQIEPRFVRSTDDLGLRIRFNVEATGTDRLVNSYAATKKYGVPCTVVSFGTATTIDVVSAENEYLGGLIAPGMTVVARALSQAASQLPEVEISKPVAVIARTTRTAIQSGIVNGQIAMVNGLLREICLEINDRPKIVATGGFAELLADKIDQIDLVDSDLTLEGLKLLNRN